VRNSRRTRWTFGLLMLFGLAFIYVPLGVIVINSFNASTVFAWPPKSFTTHWWSATFGNQSVRSAVLTSIEVGIVATAVALVLGTLLAFALGRYTFFGRHTLSLLVVLPIALPGIVTALAFRTGFRTFLGLELSIWTVAIAHATFCIVVVYNNVLARLRRTGTSPEEASMDLGADTFTTFRLVTFPLLRGAMVAGALLAFGLSFDEIVVTLFTAPPGVTTLPIWIFQNLSRPNQGPVVNVVAAVLVLASIIPIYLSQKVAGESTGGGRI
jgi:putative spermidine/putrescine transport system permease protein